MNIAFVSHPYHRGGVTQWMANAFNSWNEDLGKAYFVTVEPKTVFISGADRPLVSSMLNPSFADNIFKIKIGRLFELGTMRYKASAYRNIIHEKIRVGVPIIPSDDEACWIAAASCANRNPMIAILHADEEIYFQLADRYKEFVCAFICVSSRILKKLLNRFPDLYLRAMALPCGILVNQFQSKTVRANTITWIGRLSVYQKRAQDILKIFKEVHAQLATVRLNVLGHGDYLELLKQEIENHHMGEYISLMGWVTQSEVKDTLSETKVFLQTSDFEGTSVAMMEALASGCAIVSTRVSGIEDIATGPLVRDKIYLYETGNINEGAALVLTALNAYSNEIAKEAQSLANEYFDCYKNNRKLINFVDDVLIRNSSVKSVFRISKMHIYTSYPIACMRWLKWKAGKVINIFRS